MHDVDVELKACNRTAWLNSPRKARYRKAQCRYVLDATDAGTGADDAQRDCMVRLARQRIAELKNGP